MCPVRSVTYVSGRSSVERDLERYSRRDAKPGRPPVRRDLAVPGEAPVGRRVVSNPKPIKFAHGPTATSTKRSSVGHGA